MHHEAQLMQLRLLEAECCELAIAARKPAERAEHFALAEEYAAQIVELEKRIACMREHEGPPLSQREPTLASRPGTLPHPHIPDSPAHTTANWRL